MDFDMEMWKYAVRLKRPIAEPSIRFVQVPNAAEFLMGVDVRLNSHGLRGPDFSLTKAPGVYRILMLGDSTTLGWGVREEDTIAYLLQAELNSQEKAVSYEVINAGIGNYNTVQEVAYFDRFGKAFAPDFVILTFFVNDPEPLPITRNGTLARHSYLHAFLASRVERLLRITGMRPDWKEYYASLYKESNPGLRPCLEALKSLGTSQNGTLVLIALLPELRSLNGGKQPFRLEYDAVEAVLGENSIPFIDLTSTLADKGPENRLWVNASDDHPNGIANRLIASELATVIKSRVGLGARTWNLQGPGECDRRAPTNMATANGEGKNMPLDSPVKGKPFRRLQNRNSTLFRP
jgi:lysophospholipase L1-like esterase